jgi:hypothetical protein
MLEDKTLYQELVQQLGFQAPYDLSMTSALSASHSSDTRVISC